MSTDNICKKLRQLTAEERIEFFNSFDLILCDCDGVIWMILGSIPGSGEALQFLKSKGKQVKFVSNNSLRPDEEYMAKFAKIGIKDVKEHDVVHPAKTMAWYLNKTKPNAKVFPLIPQPATDLLIKHGIEAVPVDINAYNFSCATFASYLLEKESRKVDAVIVDLNIFTCYAHLIKALQYLKDPDCELIFGAMDLIVPITPNLTVPGFVNLYEMLTKSSKKEGVILGKPSVLLGDFLKERFSITNPKRCLFVGDSLRQDISFAKSTGFQTLFVLTGCDTLESMHSAPNEWKPDYYTESVADFIDLFVE